MFAGTALSVRLFVYAGLSLFIIYGPYLYEVVCAFYAYNLTLVHLISVFLYIIYSFELNSCTNCVQSK